LPTTPAPRSQLLPDPLAYNWSAEQAWVDCNSREKAGKKSRKFCQALSG
jgi:hypothetical protein